MSLFSSIRLAANTLRANEIALQVVGQNLANANTTRTPEGGPYKRKDVIFAAQSQGESFKSMLQSGMKAALSAVSVAGIVEGEREPQLKYQPGHPDANAEGYVATPNINVIEEMVNMVSATRSYEAGVSAINASKKMALKALEIGR